MGETVTDTIAKIVEREADWSSLPRRTPARIHELLRRCLQKDSRERVRDIGDARIEIRTALSTPEEIRPSSETDSWSRKGLTIVASLLAGVVVATVFVSHWTPSPDATVVRFGIPLAPTDHLSDPSGRVVAFSATGSHIAYAANGMLYLRAIKSNSRPQSCRAPKEPYTRSFLRTDNRLRSSPTPSSRSFLSREAIRSPCARPMTTTRLPQVGDQTIRSSSSRDRVFFGSLRTEAIRSSSRKSRRGRLHEDRSCRRMEALCCSRSEPGPTIGKARVLQLNRSSPVTDDSL